jgi:very-short-patch-repair endonuclease
VTTRLPLHWVPEVAWRQDGVFTPAQAIRAGATPKQVRRFREEGHWRRVIGVGLTRRGLDVTPGRLVQAGCLTWPGAVAAFTTAAAFHRLPVPADGLFHAVVLRRRHARPGMVPHEIPLGPDDVVPFGAGAVTTASRTVLDCLGRLPGEDAERLVTWAATREIVTAELLARAIDTRSPAWGTRALRRALADVDRGALSAAEQRLHRLLDRDRLRGWEADVQVHDGDGLVGRVDVLFPAAKVVIEVDGYAYHSRAAFQADRTKQNRLIAAGYTVLRFTWADLTERPEAVLKAIRTATTTRAPR